MIQAYVLFALVVIHGLLYASWVAIYNQARKSTHRSILVFPVLNPTYLYHEVWPGNQSSLGIWRASLIFTGLTTSSIMLAVFVTTFPVIRRKHFNVFYFTHLVTIIAVVVICLHASTMFYCAAPGLAMWTLDWGMRIYELSGKMESTLVAVGKGWFCLTVPLPRNRRESSFLSYMFLIHHTFGLARLALGVKELPGPVPRLQYDPKRDFLTPKSSSRGLRMSLSACPFSHTPCRIIYTRNPPFHNHYAPGLREALFVGLRQEHPDPVSFPQK